MNKGFMKWIEENYGIINFCNNIMDWYEMFNEVNIPYTLSQVPEEYTNNFLEKGVFYRGMVLTKEYSLEEYCYCSWTSDYDIAKDFSEGESNIQNLLDEGYTVYSVVYEYTGEAINFNKVIEAILDFIKKEDIYEKTKRQLQLAYDEFKKEKEYIALLSLDYAVEFYTSDAICLEGSN